MKEKKNGCVIDEIYLVLSQYWTPMTPWSINFLVYFSTQTSHLTVRTLIILIFASLAPMQTFAELNKHVLLTKATK